MIKPAVLVVDDEPIIVESLARDLECGNFAVSKASNGAEARLMLQKYRYDLIITDLVMPEAGGMEVLRSAKSALPNAGVFILTGYGDMASAIEALRLGADDYLIKPCDPDELMLRVERFMEKLEALRTIKIYEDILPICMYCKKIRDGAGADSSSGDWVTVEEYILRKSGTMVSHGLCPECFDTHKND